MIIVAHDFAARLRAARKAANLTQGELAAAARLSRGALTQYELGRNQPTVSRLVALCTALKVSPNWLLCGAEVSTGDSLALARRLLILAAEQTMHHTTKVEA